MIRFKVDDVEHEFDEERLTFGEGRALERVTDIPFSDLGNVEHKGNLTVIQAFIWVALKRDEPTLKFGDLDDRAIADFEFLVDEEEDADEDVRPTSGGEPSSSAA